MTTQEWRDVVNGSIGKLKVHPKKVVDMVRLNFSTKKAIFTLLVIIKGVFSMEKKRKKMTMEHGKPNFGKKVNFGTGAIFIQRKCRFGYQEVNEMTIIPRQVAGFFVYGWNTYNPSLV